MVDKVFRNRMRTIIYILTLSLFWIAVYSIPDYMRSLKCTQESYATVIDVKPNYIGKRVYSYNYKFCLTKDNEDKIFGISDCRTQFSIGDCVLVQYSKDGVLYRLPNDAY